MPAAGISRLVAHGGPGNDHIRTHGQSYIPSEFYGGPGNDQLRGGKGDDSLFGGAGDDKLLGSDGNDVLVGSEGNDVLIGQKGNDLVIAGAGRDEIDGGPGDDLLIGGFTIYDHNRCPLDILLAKWQSTDDYPARVNRVRQDTGHFVDEPFLEPGDSLMEDEKQDKFFRVAALDLLFAGPEDKIDFR